MKIQLLETDPVWEQPERNRIDAAEMAFAAGDADLLILPEMFTTGFTMSPGGLPAGERDGSLTLEWMIALARERDAAVAGSVAVEEGGKFYNRMYFVKPDGHYTVYDKRHLFGFADEDKYYTPGSERVVVEWQGVRILLQICYDLRFPVFSRTRADYDLIIYVANWPRSRIGAWDTLLRARAIENVCYVAGVNRTGSDPSIAYGGHSALIDYKGEDVASGYMDSEQVAAFRARFPALDDADDFILL